MTDKISVIAQIRPGKREELERLLEKGPPFDLDGRGVRAPRGVRRRLRRRVPLHRPRRAHPARAHGRVARALRPRPQDDRAPVGAARAEPDVRVAPAGRRPAADPRMLLAGRLPAVACRAVIFDFNGTLSDDEPILYGIYASLFAEHGRPLPEADYYRDLAGLSDPEIVHRWLGRRDDAEQVVHQRVNRYREAVADGSTIHAPVRGRRRLRRRPRARRDRLGRGIGRDRAGDRRGGPDRDVHGRRHVRPRHSREAPPRGVPGRARPARAPRPGPAGGRGDGVRGHRGRGGVGQGGRHALRRRRAHASAGAGSRRRTRSWTGSTRPSSSASSASLHDERDLVGGAQRHPAERRAGALGHALARAPDVQMTAGPRAVVEDGGRDAVRELLELAQARA